jgi:DNA excision repair protein ERCC-6-like 2
MASPYGFRNMESRQIISISDGDDNAVERTIVNAHSTKKRKHFDEIVQWTDDSDGINNEDAKKCKGNAIETRRKSSGKNRAKVTDPRRRRRSKKRKSGVSSPDEEDPEELLPGYLQERLQERRLVFNENYEILQEAGLRLPPDYSDICFSDDERLETLEEKPKFDEKSGVRPCREYKDVILEQSAGVVPASIARYLRDYQIEGVKFLHRQFVYQEGCILGDDMGLGKTVQVAAFLTAVFGKTGDSRDAKRMRKFRRRTDRWYPRVLIICPGTLTQNWRSELNRWGWWQIDLYHGAAKEQVLAAARAGRLEIMITTYETYTKDSDHINLTAWDVVVADECHKIKDPRTSVTRAMNNVNSLCRVGLTGTAIQNKYEELWTLLNWTNPGRFGTLGEWKLRLCKTLTIGQSHDATPYQLSAARKLAKKLVENILPPFFLRRMKSLIAHQLPKKSDKVVFCPLSDIQQEAYENLVESDLVDFVKLAYVKCECGSDKKRGWCCHVSNADGETWQSLVFPLIMSLQKLSSHLILLIPRGTDPADKQKRDLRYLQAAIPSRWRELYNSRDSILNLANPEFCGKWAVLKKLLRFWHGSGDKVLVFSHSVRLLRILQHLFNNTSYSVSYLDGSLSYEDRQKTVDDFNCDPNQFVFLISTKAGGVGLNITSANKVVIMDPHWNPSYDLQAQDRAYRIGQVRDVDVYRLISAGTIEEITYARQIYKQQQANIGYTASTERRYFKGVQQDKDRKGEIFGIENLFSFHADQVMLRDIVNKTNIAEAKAGVRLTDIDMEQVVADAVEPQAVKKEEDSDDGGLSQLAALLTKEEKTGSINPETAKQKKSDAIQAILSSAGVQYTHENSEVVGSSKVEERLSRRAELNVTNSSDRAIFFDSQDVGVDDDQDGTNLLYNPPEDVVLRQFCTMAQTFGFPNATDFALVVESMTQKQRRNCLELFYKKRLELLKGPGEGEEVEGFVGKSETFVDGESKGQPGTKIMVKDDVEKMSVPFKHKAKVEDDDEGHDWKLVAEFKQEAVVKNEDEDEKSTPLVTGQTKAEQGLLTDLVVKEEHSSPLIANNSTTSIWLSDDDETDEL